MSSANRKDKPLSNTPAGVYRRLPVLNSVTLALLILFLVIFAVSNRRQRLVNREMLLLMRDQLEQLKAAAPGDDTAELTGIAESLDDSEEGAAPGRPQAVADRRIIELEERLGLRLDQLERLILARKEPSEYLSEEYAELGRIGEDEGDYNRASVHYQESLEHRESPEVLLAHAQSLYRADAEVRDDEQIIRSLKSALALDPSGIDALSLLGTVYLERGDSAEALKSYTVLAELSPDDPTIHRTYGRLLLSSGQSMQAIDSLRIASAAFPESAALWRDLGLSHAAAGQHGEAATAFETALEADSGYAPAFLDLGRSQIALGQGTEAVKSALAYTARREGDYRGHLLLGDAHALLRNTLRAERAWSKALSTLGPSGPDDIRRWEEASIRLVDSMLRRGRYRGVLDIATAALEYGDNVFLLASASTAADKLGDTKAAQEFAERLERIRGAL